MDELSAAAELVLNLGQWNNGSVGKATMICVVAMGGMGCATAQSKGKRTAA